MKNKAEGKVRVIRQVYVARRHAERERERKTKKAIIIREKYRVTRGIGKREFGELEYEFFQILQNLSAMNAYNIVLQVILV